MYDHTMLDVPAEPCKPDPAIHDDAQRIRDHLLCLLPSAIHAELHQFVDELVSIQKSSLTTIAHAGSSLTRALENSSSVVKAVSDTYDVHEKALCDRVVNMLRCVWLANDGNNLNPAYKNFEDAYRKWRETDDGQKNAQNTYL